MIGFLHTSPVHVATFNQLMSELAPQQTMTHLVDEQLLADARIYGLTEELQKRIQLAVQQLVSRGATQVVCTCSTIGNVAENTPVSDTVSVTRVDRPLAEKAVLAGQRITVLATLESTLATTEKLLRETAAHLGRSIELLMVVSTHAWPFFEQGDLDGYFQAIAETITKQAPTADVIVLAQASMAPAAGLCHKLNIPILSSPRIAIETLRTSS